MRVSMHDVAKEASVSQAAVSRVVNNNGYVSEEKRKRILAAIEKMGYRPNTLARSLVTNKSCTIGLCVPYLNTPFIANLMEGVEAESEKHGYDVFMSHTKEDPEVERKALSRMLDRRVDGMLVVPVVNEKRGLEEAASTVPTIFLLRKPKGVSRNLISAADYLAAKRSFALLLDNGHRDIAVISGPTSASTIVERWQAIADLTKERGVRIKPSSIIELPFDYKTSYGTLRKLFERKRSFSGVYVMHYWASAALLKVFFELNVRIPEDYSVVTYESFEDWDFFSHNRIASNFFPAKNMGVAAVSKLHELIVNNELYMTENVVIEQKFEPFNSVTRINGK